MRTEYLITHNFFKTHSEVCFGVKMCFINVDYQRKLKNTAANASVTILAVIITNNLNCDFTDVTVAS